MPEIFRALTLVLVLGMPTLLWCEHTFFAADPPRAQSSGAVPKLWPLWLILTLAGFLLPSLLAFLAFATLWLWIVGRREPVAIALYLAVILILPPLTIELPALGIVNRLLDISLPWVAALVLLGPQLLGHGQQPRGFGIARIGVLLYLGWLTVLTLVTTSFTEAMRFCVALVIGVYLPFEGARKSLRRREDMHRVMALYVTMATTVAVIGMFEYLKAWLLYGALPAHWNANHGLFIYLARSGGLRAQATAGQPIVLGYVIAIALPFAYSLGLYQGKPARRWAVVLLLLGGLFATLSRGPWVGAAMGTLSYVALGPKGVTRAAQTVAAGAVVLAVLAVLPGGEKITALLPFIGTVETNTITYRKDLFDSTLPLLIEHPVFGIPDFATLPELQHLKQGGDMIDLVNTYVAVAIGSGLVGLLLFVLPHVAVLAGLARLLRKKLSAADHELLRTFFAAYATAMMTISTVSSISVVALIYWSFAGLGSGLLAIFGTDAVAGKLPSAGGAGTSKSRRGPQRLRSSAGTRSPEVR